MHLYSIATLLSLLLIAPATGVEVDTSSADGGALLGHGTLVGRGIVGEPIVSQPRILPRVPRRHLSSKANFSPLVARAQAMLKYEKEIKAGLKITVKSPRPRPASSSESLLSPQSQRPRKKPRPEFPTTSKPTSSKARPKKDPKTRGKAPKESGPEEESGNDPTNIDHVALDPDRKNQEGSYLLYHITTPNPMKYRPPEDIETGEQPYFRRISDGKFQTNQLVTKGKHFRGVNPTFAVAVSAGQKSKYPSMIREGSLPARYDAERTMIGINPSNSKLPTR